MLQKWFRQYFAQEVFLLHGGIPRKKRDEMVEIFQNAPEAPKIFILSLKAGGTGLTLTRANHVIHFDRWWNPAVENQATDRAFRIGQKKNVQVHTFIVPGTPGGTDRPLAGGETGSGGEDRGGGETSG